MQIIYKKTNAHHVPVGSPASVHRSNHQMSSRLRCFDTTEWTGRTATMTSPVNHWFNDAMRHILDLFSSHLKFRVSSHICCLLLLQLSPGDVCWAFHLITSLSSSSSSKHDNVSPWPGFRNSLIQSFATLCRRCAQRCKRNAKQSLKVWFCGSRSRIWLQYGMMKRKPHLLSQALVQWGWWALLWESRSLPSFGCQSEKSTKFAQIQMISKQFFIRSHYATTKFEEVGLVSSFDFNFTVVRVCLRCICSLSLSRS